MKTQVDQKFIIFLACKGPIQAFHHSVDQSMEPLSVVSIKVQTCTIKNGKMFYVIWNWSTTKQICGKGKMSEVPNEAF